LFFLRKIILFFIFRQNYFNLPGVIRHPAGKGTLFDGWSAAGKVSLN